jgi:hypothetical protein
MSSEQLPNDRQPSDDVDSGELFPATESRGELVPPPRKPPTALMASAATPEPRPPQPVYGWRRTPTVPGALVRAVDAVLDVLDAVGDSVRATADRLAR